MKVGDRVIIVRDLTKNFDDRIGERGVIIEVKYDGLKYPFKVKFDNESLNGDGSEATSGVMWCEEEMQLDKEYSIRKLLTKIDER